MLPIVHNNLRVLNRRRRNRRLILERRFLRDRSNPFELSEERFVELYRLNQEAARYLIEVVEGFIETGTYQNVVPPFIRILTTLRFLATGSYQRDLGLAYNTGLSQTSVHRCIQQIVPAIEAAIVQQEIKFPVLDRDRNEIKATFMERFGFPGTIGCIDGTHIAILKPVENEQNFVNRRGYHSINVQIICDANLKILSVNANYPGLNHDSFIWRQSNIREVLIREYLANRLRGSWLIGDSGYFLEPILMIPFLNPAENSPEERYNRSLVAARNCVERCIGLWKNRFRVLMRERTCRYSPNFVGRLVNVCSALHNLCLRFNVPFDEENPILQNNAMNIGGNPQNVGPLRGEGINVRNNIVNRYFN